MIAVLAVLCSIQATAFGVAAWLLLCATPPGGFDDDEQERAMFRDFASAAKRKAARTPALR